MMKTTGKYRALNVITGHGRERDQDKALLRTVPACSVPLLVVLALGAWMLACSGPGDRGPTGAPPRTPSASITSQGLESAPVAGSAGSEQGASTPGDLPEGPRPPDVEESKGSASNVAAKASTVQPKTLSASDRGQGGVTVEATWVTSGSKEAATVELDRYLGFKLAMDTHSVNLGQYDLKKLSTLRDNKGKEIPPVVWQATSDDSHHREGVLKFARGPEQGSSYLELVIKDVAGVRERILRWDMGQ